LRSLWIKIRDIYKRDGFGGLWERAITFPGRRHFLGLRWEARYYIEHALVERNEQDFLSKILDITFYLVRSNQEADELETQGYEFRSYQEKARRCLESGSIAFCFFVGHELAHIGWVSLTTQSKPCIDDWIEVDFANRESCTGATITIPEFRGKGLMTYGYYKRLEYLKQMGSVRTRASVGTKNIASLRTHAKFDPRIYARARYMKVLWWESWEVKPILPPISPAIVLANRH